MDEQISRQDVSPKVPNNKFMYVKQQLVGRIENGQPKVLINPNFVQVAHVKPHFNKNFLLNQTIHVNPQMLKRNNIEPVQQPRIIDPVSNIHVPNKAILTTPTKLIRVPQKRLDNLGNIVNTSINGNILVSTRTKLVRVPKPKAENTSIRSPSINTKYKIIRNSTVSKSYQKKEADIKKLYYVKNRFMIDHRTPTKKLVSNYKPIRRSSIFNRSLNTTLTTKNVYVKYNSKLNKTQYVSINGILYKKNLKSLVNLNEKIKNKSRTKKILKEQLLTIRGQKYKLDSNHRTLTLLSRKDENVKPSFKTIYLGGVTFKQKEPNVFVKTNTNQKHVLLSQAKQKSIHTLTNKMRKSNIPCPFYRKFGRCKGKEKGTCIRIHNPDQISLCPKFLQGACINDKCLLSHKVSAEKMPTCKFFLEGLCSKDDCSYLHVKINAKAEICKEFLEGFCKKAAECDKRHQYLCPDYEKTGNCTKRRCQYPHGNMVRMYKFSKIASKLQIQSKSHENVSVLQTKLKNHPGVDASTSTKLNNNLNSDIVEIDENIPEKALNMRYYDDSAPDTSTDISHVQKDCAEFEIVDLDLEDNSAVMSPLRTRPKVGALPSFIPLLDEEQS